MIQTTVRDGGPVVSHSDPGLYFASLRSNLSSPDPAIYGPALRGLNQLDCAELVTHDWTRTYIRPQRSHIPSVSQNKCQQHLTCPLSLYLWLVPLRPLPPINELASTNLFSCPTWLHGYMATWLTYGSLPDPHTLSSVYPLQAGCSSPKTCLNYRSTSISPVILYSIQ